MDGILIVNKPSGITSHDVVAKARKMLNTQKIGHVGTLDPLATGVMVLCVDKALKLAEFMVSETKSYRAVAKLGATSDTGDAEGKLTQVIARALPLSRPLLEKELAKLEGKQIQIPPKYSAIKIKGKPAYKRVREGEDFEMPEREIEIFAMHLIRFEWPELEFKIKCSSGTYVRSVVETLGENLKCGAYLSELKRTRAGAFTLKDACELNEISEKKLLPASRAIEHLKRIKVADTQLEDIRHGKAISTTERFSSDPGLIALMSGSEVVAVAKYDAEKFTLLPTKVLI